MSPDPAVIGPLSSCVFEVTLACDARCRHCGSDAGKARADELTTAEATALFDALAALGCRCVTLSGGEPLLRGDWPTLVDRIRLAGMRAELISNGLSLESQADRVARAGFFAVTLSVDGTPEVHDALRGVPGAFARLRAGALALLDSGVLLGAATQVNRLNLPVLGRIHDLLVEIGFSGWQVQLTMPHGRAAAHDGGMCLAPGDLPTLARVLLEVKAHTGLFVQAADNIGYMSRSEPLLRAGSPDRAGCFGGCQAGLNAIGITSDGTVRGCLSMPDAFDEGNIRERSLADIWRDPDAFAYNRRFDASSLVGGCLGCAFARICRGGCRSLAFASTGGVGSNPYCLHLLERAGEAP